MILRPTRSDVAAQIFWALWMTDDAAISAKDRWSRQAAAYLQFLKSL